VTRKAPPLAVHGDNGTGAIVRPLSVVMRAYDGLPPRVRRALIAADVTWDPIGLAEHVAAFGADEVARVIPAVAAATLAEDALEAYGPEHPQALPLATHAGGSA
jgi:hypothetical protein